MNTEISEIYRKLCLENQIKASEFILSCLYNASKHGDLNLGNNTISETSCTLIAETLKLVPKIKILNLSDCLLSIDSLKMLLDVVNELDNLLLLDLKGNQIGKNITNYISKILLNNHSITELRLDWNSIGISISTFAQFCNSLISNTVLNTLNLANNNLRQECSFHLAKLINANRCLKSIDLSWNCLGETGAVLLLKSLKSNEILIELNIHGNGICEKTSTMIDKHLKQNKSNIVNQKIIQNKNLSLLEYVASADKMYQIQLTSLNNQYQTEIDELRLKSQFLERDNQNLKQEIKELKKYNLKEKESNKVILNQAEKVKSELSFQNKSLNSLIKEISNEISNSEIENLDAFEDLDKIIYIINQIKNKYSNNCEKEIKLNKRLSESIPKLSNELNAIKSKLKNLKSSMEMEIKDFFDKLAEIKKIFFSDIYHLKISNKINNEMQMNNLIGQQQESNFSDEQTNILVLINENIKSLHKEKTDLEMKLVEAESKSVVNTQTLQTLENSLMSTKEELHKFNKKQLSHKVAQTSNEQPSTDAFAKEIDTLQSNLIEKERQLQYCETEKDNMTDSYKTELLTLEKKLESEKQKCAEQKEADLKQIEELYAKFTRYITELRKKYHEDTTSTYSYHV